MCEQNHQIQLCTCVKIKTTPLKTLLKNELSKLKKKESCKLIKWKLNRYIKKEWIGLDGMLFSPVHKLTSQITSEYLFKELNTRNCFDFEYIPIQGDNLIFEIELINKNGKPLKNQPQYQFISFIFKNSEWQIDSYNSFYDNVEEINNGIIKFYNKNK